MLKFLSKRNRSKNALLIIFVLALTIGFAQAGAGGFFDDGGFPAGQGWDVVDFPVSPAQKAGCYALEVQGDSMMPLYLDGDVLIVEPGAQVHVHRVVAPVAGGQDPRR